MHHTGSRPVNNLLKLHIAFIMKKAQIHIGTSGWHYKHWIGKYYPGGTKDSEQLGFYIKDFSTVEINNSFYRLPPRDAFVQWQKAVPDDFMFSVKASRYITHMKKLKDPEESLSQLVEHASGLGAKLGPVLFQLPPGWKINAERLEEFLEALPKKWRCVFEFRNSSWYHEEVYEALRRHNCAFCIYELDGHTTPVKVTADFVYIRLHGPGDKYQGSYSASDLRKWQKLAEGWLDEGRDVFVYFDNDQAAYAAFNAKSLIAMMK